jgi:hypothetical protein
MKQEMETLAGKFIKLLELNPQMKRIQRSISEKVSNKGIKS